MKIQVLGTGCPKCEEACTVVAAAIAQSGKAMEVEKVSDLQTIARMGVFVTPAVVVDGQIKAVGRVPAIKDVLAWLG